MDQEEASPIDTVTPQEIYDKLIEDAAVHKNATDSFIENFVFFDKSLLEHSRELYVDIPKNITPEIYRDIYIKLARNIQIASNYLTVSNTISSAIMNGNSNKRASLVKAIAESYERRRKRRPGREIIEAMADSYMNSTFSLLASSKIVKDFWSKKLESLIEVRKCMEQIGISIHSEMKYLENFK